MDAAMADQAFHEQQLNNHDAHVLALELVAVHAARAAASSPLALRCDALDAVLPLMLSCPRALTAALAELQHAWSRAHQSGLAVWAAAGSRALAPARPRPQLSRAAVECAPLGQLRAWAAAARVEGCGDSAPLLQAALVAECASAAPSRVRKLLSRESRAGFAARRGWPVSRSLLLLLWSR
jgi:hypothetical protein